VPIRCIFGKGGRLISMGLVEDQPTNRETTDRYVETGHGSEGDFTLRVTAAPAAALNEGRAS
jgi:hypothetical protein